MIYYDRYFGQTISILPKEIDLGRIAIIDASDIRDLTNSEVENTTMSVVRETIFADANQNVWDLLDTIANSYQNEFRNVLPVIQNFNIETKPFERLLENNLSHLRAIVANPHTLLDKDTQKVNIGRAKRISTRSYQHLAHHSEDWEKMSILYPKPRKILHEELIIDHMVYENVLLKAFLQTAIKHLNKRVKETADISKFFLSIFGAKWICSKCNFEFDGDVLPKLCPHCNEQTKWRLRTLWADKIERRNALVGRAVKSDRSKESDITNRALAQLRMELQKLDHSTLFDEFPKTIANSVVFHDTNVLNAHKHYKYLKILWLEFAKMKDKQSEKDPFVIHQDIMNNMRIYVVTLFVYSLRLMEYDIVTDKNVITANHKSLPSIQICSDKYGVMKISTHNAFVNIISLGGLYDIENTKNLPTNTLCFCFCDYQKPREHEGHVYFVNPIDTNSIECSGHVIRKLIMQQYIATIDKRIDYKHNLRDFVSVIKCKDISFDSKYFTYSLLDHVPAQIDELTVLTNLREFSLFKERSRREQEGLVKDFSELIQGINEHCAKIRKTLVCPKCSKEYRKNNIRYLVCDCGFICDLTNNNSRLFHQQKDESFSHIQNKDWGMDFVD